MAITYSGMREAALAAADNGATVTDMNDQNVKPMLLAWLLVVTNEGFWNPDVRSPALLTDDNIQEIATKLGVTPETIKYVINTANAASPEQKAQFSAVAQQFSSIGSASDYGDLACPGSYQQIPRIGVVVVVSTMVLCGCATIARAPAPPTHFARQKMRLRLLVSAVFVAVFLALFIAVFGVYRLSAPSTTALAHTAATPLAAAYPLRAEQVHAMAERGNPAEITRACLGHSQGHDLRPARQARQKLPVSGTVGTRNDWDNKCSLGLAASDLCASYGMKYESACPESVKASKTSPLESAVQTMPVDPTTANVAAMPITSVRYNEQAARFIRSHCLQDPARLKRLIAGTDEFDSRAAVVKLIWALPDASGRLYVWQKQHGGHTAPGRSWARRTWTWKCLDLHHQGQFRYRRSLRGEILSRNLYNRLKRDRRRPCPSAASTIDSFHAPASSRSRLQSSSAAGSARLAPWST